MRFHFRPCADRVQALRFAAPSAKVDRWVSDRRAHRREEANHEQGYGQEEGSEEKASQVAAGEARREEGEETEPGISSLRCRQAQGSRPAGRFACVSRLCMMYRAQHADYLTFLMPAWVQHPRVESSRLRSDRNPRNED